MNAEVYDEYEPSYDEECAHLSKKCCPPKFFAEAPKYEKSKKTRGTDEIDWPPYKPVVNNDEDRKRELSEHIKNVRIKIKAKKEQQEQEIIKLQELQQEEQLRKQHVKNKNDVVRSPPIYVYNIDPIELKDICKLAIGNNFIIDFMSKDVFMVHCNTMEQYENVQKILELSKKDFSLTTRENVYRRMALYGLDPLTEPSELLNLLKQHECDQLKFINIKFFRTRRGPAFLVNISFDSSVDVLNNIDTINNQVVTWEAYILQCYNCQQYDHRGSRCRLQPQCVKCAKNHLSSECPIKMEGFIDKLFKCAICDNIGHTADSTQCPRFQYEQEHRMYKGQKILAKSGQDLNNNIKASETKSDKELREFMCTMTEQIDSVCVQMQNLTSQMEIMRAEMDKHWLKNPQSKE